MALIPIRNLIKEAMEIGDVAQEFRTYIGMSGLNGKCARATWYNFHWAYDRTVSRRIQRIFDRGDLEEARVVTDLRKAGMIVTYALDEQLELVDETGHIKGHPDGIVGNVPGAEKTDHLLEIKTMNNKRFSDYVKKGLLATNPSYWGQVHMYMGEQKLTRCLFVVTNKDNEERHYERIKYDKAVHKECMSRGFDILTAEIPPKRIGEATWFECKMCDYRPICHKGEPIKRTCRSCKHVNIEMKGEWSCGLYDNWLNKEDQLLACGDYKLNEVYE